MPPINRRNLLASATAMTSVVAMGSAARANVPANRDPFDYEVTRTDDEWRALLGDDYAILREGKTELPRSSPLWAEAREGTYALSLIHI